MHINDDFSLILIIFGDSLPNSQFFLCFAFLCIPIDVLKHFDLHNKFDWIATRKFTAQLVKQKTISKKLTDAFLGEEEEKKNQLKIYDMVFDLWA